MAPPVTDPIQPVDVRETSLAISTSMVPLNTNAQNLCLEWKSWSRNFKIFMRASGLETQQDQRKVALLLHHIGCGDIVNSFNIDIDTIMYKVLWEKFEKYFVPKKNTAMERHMFFTRKQAIGETITQYSTVLQNLSITCEFGDIRESLVKDIFTCGLSQNFQKIKEKLLSEGEITWDKALQIAKGMEAARENATAIEQVSHSSSNICGLKKSSYKSKNKSFNNNNKSNLTNHQQQQAKCNKCGQSHNNKCPADGMKCHVCGKLNHFAKMCFAKSNNNNKNNHSNNYKINNKHNNRYVKAIENEDENLFIGSVFDRKGDANKEWNVEAVINNKKVQFQVDTGAQYLKYFEYM